MHSWGVAHDAENEERGVNAVMEDAMRGNLYFGGRTPEEQFCDALAERKRAALDAARPAAEPRFACDYTLRVALALDKWDDKEVSPPTWRRLRCSGGVTLGAFADKILAPALGWCRNYHGYIFTDRTDGAQFGAPNSSAIDMVRPLARRHAPATGAVFASPATRSAARTLTVTARVRRCTWASTAGW